MIGWFTQLRNMIIFLPFSILIAKLFSFPS